MKQNKKPVLCTRNPKQLNMANENTAEGLKRVVGVSGLALTIVGFTIGAGIFALPAIVGVELGAFAVFSYIFCGIMYKMLCDILYNLM